MLTREKYDFIYSGFISTLWIHFSCIFGSNLNVQQIADFLSDFMQTLAKTIKTNMHKYVSFHESTKIGVQTN